MAQAEITRLQMLIAVLLRNRFGRRSERLGEEALQQGIEDIEQSLAEQEAKLEAAQPAAERPAKPPKRNRGSLPKHLPRVEVVVDIADKTGGCCGAPLHAIGEDRSEMLDYVPAQIRVQVIRRPRYGCRACEGAVVQAPALERPIDGGLATEALLAHVLVNKYADHLPLYRQSQIFARQGVDLDRSTLCNWVGRACRWLEPLYERVLSTVLSSPRLAIPTASPSEPCPASPKVVADDTTLPVLDPGRGRTKTGRLWCYAVDNRPWSGPGHPAAAYAYSEDRKGEHPATQLKGFRKRPGRRLSIARLRQNAVIEDADLRTPHGPGRSLFQSLTTCGWIRDNHHVLIGGPTGVGKSWLACALGHKACRDGFSVLYRRAPRLFADLATARGEGRLVRLMRSLERTRLLIIDDWGPEPLNAEQRRDLLEIVDDQEGKASLLITSQVPIGRRHEIIGDPTLGDAILDRVIHRSHRIELKGESLRKRQALAAVESLTNAKEK